ncbi:MAG: pitrilysin family protein [Pseudomonadota bacterium]|nr:pitrilysin family protein [Pseudomonadota bacterium]
MTTDEPVRLSTLENGLRIISESTSTLETASVGVWVNAGSRYETKENNGISHLLEHMAFKGTTTRTARNIAEEIENVGGHLNAYTSKEQTAYYAKVLRQDLPLATEILSDILENPIFSEDELTKEKEVVIQEMGQTRDTPDDIIFDKFQELAYPDQPIGRPILGTAENVRAFSPKTLSNYMAKHYTPDRMVVSAAGNLRHEDLIDLTADFFHTKKSLANPQLDQAEYVGGFIQEKRDLDQMHLVLGFDGLAYDDDDYYALQVFSVLFGGGMSSRLFQKIREEKGLAYSVYSFATSYADSGLFGIYAGTSQEATSELIETVCEELEKVTKHITNTETSRACAQLKSGLLMSLESTSSRCGQLARQVLLFGRPLSHQEIIKKIDAVDPEQLRHVIQKILNRGCPTMTTLGPTTNRDHFSQFKASLPV